MTSPTLAAFKAAIIHVVPWTSRAKNGKFDKAGCIGIAIRADGSNMITSLFLQQLPSFSLNETIAAKTNTAVHMAIESKSRLWRKHFEMLILYPTRPINWNFAAPASQISNPPASLNLFKLTCFARRFACSNSGRRLCQIPISYASLVYRQANSQFTPLDDFLKLLDLLHNLIHLLKSRFPRGFQVKQIMQRSILTVEGRRHGSRDRDFQRSTLLQFHRKKRPL